MVGHKLGEFAPTRTFNGHNDDDKKENRSKEGGINMEAKAVAKTYVYHQEKLDKYVHLLEVKHVDEALSILKFTPKSCFSSHIKSC